LISTGRGSLLQESCIFEVVLKNAGYIYDRGEGIILGAER